jgi:hypothetical protein
MNQQKTAISASKSGFNMLWYLETNWWYFSTCYFCYYTWRTMFCLNDTVEPRLAMSGSVSKMRIEPNRNPGYRISVCPGPNVPTAAGRYLHLSFCLHPCVLCVVAHIIIHCFVSQAESTNIRACLLAKLARLKCTLLQSVLWVGSMCLLEIRIPPSPVDSQYFPHIQWPFIMV